jgi:hypothetical protein
VSKNVLLNGSFAESIINFRGPLIAEMVARGHHVHVTSPDIPDQIASKVRSLRAHPRRVATSANSRVVFQNPDDLADFIAAGCLSNPKKARLFNGSGVDLVHF